jgi:putative two-component system response regulator
MRLNNRILAVDDNPLNLTIIEEALQGRFNLKLVQDGAEALRIAPVFQPEVILLDVMMPAPDGFEVCTRIKNNRLLQHAQVLMVSARTDMDHRLRGYYAGADDYVSKPFSEEELCAKVCAGLKRGEIFGQMTIQFRTLCSAAGEALEMVSHLRDSETGDHIMRMRTYSQILAAELRASHSAPEIDDVFLDDLYHASALHDIGKVAIPDKILRKPGKLTDSEREQMKQHAIIGESILRRLSLQHPSVTMFHMAAEIARWHHECFDGSGYPDGLIGQAIPLAARIVQVADVFDAITSARVYKQKQSAEEARQFIQAGQGQAFDPLVVDALLRVCDELRDLCEANKD